MISGNGKMKDFPSDTLVNKQSFKITDSWNYNYGHNITKLIVEDGVTYIGKYAFISLNLKEIDISKVTKIGDYAFS